jgi:hypothetical protein
MIPVYRDAASRKSNNNSPSPVRSHFRNSVFNKSGAIVPKSSITLYSFKQDDKTLSTKKPSMHLDMDDEHDPDIYKKPSIHLIKEMQTSRPCTAQVKKSVFKNTKNKISDYLTDIYKDNVSLNRKLGKFQGFKMSSDYMSKIKYYSKYASEKVITNADVMEDLENNKYSRPLFVTDKKIIVSHQSSRVGTPTIISTEKNFSKANSWNLMSLVNSIPNFQFFSNMLTGVDSSQRFTFVDDEFEKDIRILNKCTKIDKRLESNKKGMLKINILNELKENYKTGNNDFRKAYKEYEDETVKLNTSHDYDEEFELKNECINPEINAYRPGNVSLSGFGKIRTLQPRYVKTRIGFNGKVYEHVRPKDVKKRVPLYMKK